MSVLVRLVVLVASLPLLLMLTALVFGTSLYLAGDFLFFLMRLVLRF